MSAAGPSPAYCGIDVGTQGVRAVIVAADGALLGSGKAELSGDHRDGVRHEQSPDSWWHAVRHAVRDAVSAAGPDVAVAAVALDATSGTVVVEDADGVPRGPGLMYDDTRAADQAARAQRVGADLWSALGYRIQPAWALPKVLWLQEQDALRAGDRVVHQSDHLLRRLTGYPVPTDTSHALKTGVDLRIADWPEQTFAELGIGRALLPDVVLPGTVVGEVSATGAAETGLPQGAVIRAGMTDSCAAQIAARALRPGSWSSALGTTLAIKGSTPQLLHDPTGAVYCHRSPDGGWLPGGASSTGAGILRDTFPDADSDALTALTGPAAALVPVAQVVYPLAGSGERFPFVAPQARGFGLAELDSDAARFAALCQGIAYVERLAYDVLGVLGADVSGPVSLTGGPTRNDWWNQLRADVLGRPVLLPESGQAAVGMAVLAAARPGELAQTAEAMVALREVREPDPDRSAQLLPGYHRLVRALADRDWLPRQTAEAVLTRTGTSG